MSKIITTGIKSISKSKFERAVNGDMIVVNKPNGCLWGSTYNENPEDEFISSWATYCICDDYKAKIDSLSYGIIYELKDSAKIFEIDSLEDYENLMEKYSMPYHSRMMGTRLVIDWEKLAKDYDGFHISDGAVYFLRLNVPGHDDYANFYSWDCESYCLFNLDCINMESVVQYNK